MFKVSVFFILLINNFLVASGAIRIEGLTSNLADGSIVQLMQYQVSDVEIARTKISSSQFNFDLEDSIDDGIYSLILTNKSNGLHINMYKYDIIIDKGESLIKFKIDPFKETPLVILLSKINANYYEFLKIENFRIATINYIKEVINSNKSHALNPGTDFKNILEQELNELKEIRLNYIKTNFNKWSTAFVKNSTTIVLFENVNKENYWSFFSNENIDLINTPIFQNLIQNYLINYVGVATESEYKRGFEEVVRHFSYNDKLKEWVVKFIIVGLNQLGNRDLIDFFSKKYNCKT